LFVVQDYRCNVIYHIISIINLFLQVDNLEGDLCNGYVLIILIEILSGNPIKKKYTKNPTHRIQQLDNMKIVLDTLKEEGLKLVSMGKQRVIHCSTDLMD